jgi:hypothetical protein
MSGDNLWNIFANARHIGVEADALWEAIKSLLKARGFEFPDSDDTAGGWPEGEQWAAPYRWAVLPLRWKGHSKRSSTWAP